MGGDPELLRDDTQQAVGRGIVRIGHQRGEKAGVKELLVEQTGEARLARPGIAEDGGKAFTRRHDKGGFLKCRGMDWREEKVAWRGYRGERLFREVEVGEIR